MPARRIAVIIAFTFFVSRSMMAQITADQAIGFIDQVPASRLDPALPRTPFLNWLKELVGPAAKIQWEMNDCGELTGIPAVDDERDISVCIEATILLSENQKVAIAIYIGSERRGLSDRPRIANIYLEVGAEAAYFKNLSELQKTLLRLKQDR